MFTHFGLLGLRCLCLTAGESYWLQPGTECGRSTQKTCQWHQCALSVRILAICSPSSRLQSPCRAGRCDRTSHLHRQIAPTMGKSARRRCECHHDLRQKRILYQRTAVFNRSSGWHSVSQELLNEIVRGRRIPQSPAGIFFTLLCSFTNCMIRRPNAARWDRPRLTLLPILLFRIGCGGATVWGTISLSCNFTGRNYICRQHAAWHKRPEKTVAGYATGRCVPTITPDLPRLMVPTIILVRRDGVPAVLSGAQRVNLVLMTHTSWA